MGNYKPIKPKWFYIGLKKDKESNKILSDKDKIKIHEDIKKIEFLSEEFQAEKIICVTECKHIKSVQNNKEIDKKARIEKLKNNNNFQIEKIFNR